MAGLFRSSPASNVRFRSGIISLSTTLAGERVALEETDDGIWNVQFYHLLLGRLDERTSTFVP